MTKTELPLSELIAPTATLSVGTEAVDKILRAVRCHLGMDVAFVAEFRAQDRVFRHVDAKSASPLQPGDVISLEQGYCQRVVDGRLPELIPDTSRVPDAMSLPDTRSIPIGAHLSVPIRLEDGSTYGTFCCFSFRPDHSLGPRDLQMMRVFAELVADQIDRHNAGSRAHAERAARIKAVLAERPPYIVYQPIYNLQTNRIAGFECLARFDAAPKRPPNEWFAEASEVGLGKELELEAARIALQGLQRLPAHMYVTINFSPGTIASGALLELVQGVDPARVVIEITEHVHIEDYAELLGQLALLRALGMRVAIDDAGAGYASMRHILHIRPDLIKLDISLTKNIDADSTRRALAAALIAFAGETRAKVVAEGVETAAELAALKRLGIYKAQGYFLSKPLSLTDTIAFLEKNPDLSTRALDTPFPGEQQATTSSRASSQTAVG